MATLHAPSQSDDGQRISVEVTADRWRSDTRRTRAVCRASGRPPWLLATATAGALGMAILATGAQTAATEVSAETTSESMRVADALGLDPSESDTAQASDVRKQLEQLAASRTQRDSEQAAAAEAQAQAEQSAAAARAEAEARATAEAAAAQAASDAEAALQARRPAGDPEAVMPIEGARLTSPFGPRWGTLHAGVDLAAPMMTPEYAAMDGIVLQAGPASGFGQVVYIQHQNGDVTVYGHMEEILVEPGQTVQAGETIALVGNRGQSTGPHLHFEVRLGGLNGEPVDPVSYLRERGVDV